MASAFVSVAPLLTRRGACTLPAVTRQLRRTSRTCVGAAASTMVDAAHSAAATGLSTASILPPAPPPSAPDAAGIVRHRPGDRFAQLLTHGGIAYLSGQVATDTSVGVGAQTSEVLAKVDALLEEAGTSREHLLTVTVYLADVTTAPAMNEVWTTWLGDAAPRCTRATIGAPLVRPELLVEVVATAAIPPPVAPGPVATASAAAAVGPYSQGVVLEGGLVYVSGCVGLRSPADGGGLVDGGVVPQTRQALANMKAVLTAAGCSIADIVKTSIMVTDMGDFATVNGVYSEVMGEAKPARACFGVAALPVGAVVEIECIAKQP
ncbi:hypothetical protein MMPV_000501 [Pyropia vietnamensis]